ncbi:protein of unknown function [Acidithiobacillus ferrivorans]|uniref:Uncharacterized protein n=1 Tax=Acidithiobacillus ferrivorans TaxID=160808 RepID=A0A060UW29_9PROT|nr:hypothetical protein [Acidithiobacillus ferrivorans]QQD72009.1 hypothetical protein H2515_11310 [Acidithiobacillus ferrivorans]CDQ10963.1 hypothetical protein AFERRI_450006 [Acidithiobacillus ferrivorans]SMH64830.1 protein of unknown function [Acidithiobacillus ferrivorans]
MSAVNAYRVKNRWSRAEKPDSQPIGMRAGIAEQAESGKNWSDLVKLADNRMY